MYLVQAVAELYDVIAQSSAFGPVNIQTYLMGIQGTIQKSLLDQNYAIIISTKTEALKILPDHAVSIGPIVNELATNAVKYALPAGDGEVVLGFHRRCGAILADLS